MGFHNDAIFWIETGKIKPNPYQPRREFDESKLNDLAESIRQYGVLQPLVVTRAEVFREDGSMEVEYELIAGERRLRASKIAGVAQIPAVVRSGDEGDNVKLELAIIENLQREDLNPTDRARAFSKLVAEFGYKHGEVATKVGRSREYVSNTLRLLQLPEEILNALSARNISEGHARPLLMLADRPEEQGTLYKEILYKKLTVRDAEEIARRIATDRVRKINHRFSPEFLEMEEKASETLGTRVRIAPREVGGRLTIEFDSDEDLRNLIDLLEGRKISATGSGSNEETTESEILPDTNEAPADDDKTDDDLYSISNFSI